MKRLLFDLVATQPNASGKRHGGGKYGEIIFFRLIERGFRFDCIYDSRKWLNPEVEDAAIRNGCEMHDVAKASVGVIVTCGKYEVIYSCGASKDMLRLDSCEVVCTLHGMRAYETPVDNIFWKYPSTIKAKVKWMVQKYALPLWRRKLARDYRLYFESDCRLVTVSQHSRAAMMSYFPSIKKDIQVFYSPNTSLPTEAEKNSIRGKYFLMVSGNRWEKNNLRAILAFDRLVSAGLMKNIKTIVTGCLPGMYEKHIKNHSSFEFMGYVDEKVLESLYANAYCFVYPSLNEGFGYPPLEAMRYGVPVIASPLSSISELLEGGALYFNPFQVEEIMSRMILISAPQRHLEYSKAGYEKYQEIKRRQDHDLNALINYIVD